MVATSAVSRYILRGLLALAASSVIVATQRTPTVRADAPGTPIPTYAAAVDSQTARVYWKNTASESGWTAYIVGPEVEGEANFNLRYRIKGAPDDFSSYTYIGGGGPPDDRGVWLSNPLPTSGQQDELLSYVVNNLTPNTTYCFSARAYAFEDNYGGSSQVLSPWSGEVCTQTAPKPTPPPPTPVQYLNPQQIGFLNVETISYLDNPSVLITKADLNARSISGPQTFNAGIAQVYGANISNDGGTTAAGVDLVISFSGVLTAEDVIQPADGFQCSVSSLTSVKCLGGALTSATTVPIQFRAHAGSPGSGDIALSVNNSRTVDESNYGNNVQVLHVTVH
jgi:hypothetical protein